MQEDVKEIELVNYLKYKVKISNTFIEKKGNRIFFKDIVSIKCKSWRQFASYYGAKTFHGNFNRIILVDNRKNKIDLNFSSTSEESFKNFNYILSKATSPLVQKTINDIKSGTEVSIHNLKLTQAGIYKKSLFGTTFIEWGSCLDAIIDRGFVDIIKLDEKKFSSTHIWKRNAILIPSIVKSFNKK
ncbi:MAG: hypothetical protein K9M44_00060 [Candidatus Pacebacteria bacterium]|nr:hypothetical protein [Candidatus Paceibacterota bacterium]